MAPQDAALSLLAEAAGIFDAFEDMQGVVHHAGVETQRAMLRANGFAVSNAADVTDSLAQLHSETQSAFAARDIIVQAGVARSVQVQAGVTWALHAEGAEGILAEGCSDGTAVLPAMAVGYYVLQLDGPAHQQTSFVISVPRRAPSVTEHAENGTSWGVVAALYGLYGDQPKGLGDYADLGDLAAVLGAKGAGFLGINPVHALGWAADDTISPYSPTHRGFLNTDHIALPGSIGQTPPDPTDLLDYAAHRVSHREALRARFAHFKHAATTAESQAFVQFKASGGPALAQFCRFEAISETHGTDWRHWPAAQRQGDTAPMLDTKPAEMFHMWLQWQAARQLGDAQIKAQDSGMILGLYLDLAVGARLGGAETWGAEAATAMGVSLGAPPDQLSPAGQNWQLAAMSPRKLQQTHYSAFRQILRQSMRFCGVLRIDHALGLNRSFWLPDDGSPGGYIRQPFETLSGIIAVEAHLSNTVIVGEDLGLVPAGFRDQLAQKGLYGYSVLQYEKDAKGQFLPVSALRDQSLACFGTHDTPTLRGYWSGCDIAWWHKLGWVNDADLARVQSEREAEKKQLTKLYAPATTTAEGLRDALHTKLAQSPAALVAVQLDDILNTTEAQNLPGTVDEHPNWRRRAALSIKQIAHCEALATTSNIMADAGRSTKTRKDRK